MLNIDPTVLLAIVERSAPSAQTLASREAHVLIALHAFGQHPSAEARLVATRMINTYVDAMRDRDFRPEQVVVAIKAVARRAGLAREGKGLSGPHSPTYRASDMIAEEFVTAAIRRFFEPGLPRPRAD